MDESLQPLDDYYLWCDHRAWREAQEITDAAHAQRLEAIDWCGGTYSSEWGFAKLLHWLRNNPEKRERFATAIENCDMVVATLCGITSPADVPRSICAMGHKWMWNPKWDGLPSQEFLDLGRSAICRYYAKTGGTLRDIGPDRRQAERRHGPSGLVCAPAFLFRSVRSTRTGMRSPRTSGWEMW